MGLPAYGSSAAVAPKPAFDVDDVDVDGALLLARHQLLDLQLELQRFRHLAEDARRQLGQSPSPGSSSKCWLSL